MNKQKTITPLTQHYPLTAARRLAIWKVRYINQSRMKFWAAPREIAINCYGARSSFKEATCQSK